MDKLGKILGKDLSQGIMSRMLMEDVKESEATALTLAQAKANGTYVRMLDANGNTVRVARGTFIQAIRDLLPSVLADQDTNGKNFLTLLTDGTLGKTTLANAASVLGDVNATKIPNTASLDNYWDPGEKYYFQDDNNGAVSGKPISNMPVGFVFNIKFLTNNRYQFCISNSFATEGIYIRRYGGEGSTHGKWRSVNLTTLE